MEQIWSDEQKSHQAMHGGKTAAQVEARNKLHGTMHRHEGYASASVISFDMEKKETVHSQNSWKDAV